VGDGGELEVFGEGFHLPNDGGRFFRIRRL
jgi:hypothetical protein